jgi:hypothetical protein
MPHGELPQTPRREDTRDRRGTGTGRTPAGPSARPDRSPADHREADGEEHDDVHRPAPARGIQVRPARPQRRTVGGRDAPGLGARFPARPELGRRGHGGEIGRGLGPVAGEHGGGPDRPQTADEDEQRAAGHDPDRGRAAITPAGRGPHGDPAFGSTAATHRSVTVIAGTHPPSGCTRALATATTVVALPEIVTRAPGAACSASRRPIA